MKPGQTPVDDPKGAVIAALSLAVRRMSAQGIIISQTVAARFGLNTTDMECLDLLAMRGGTTAGELSRATGLTTGATTAMLDRLAAAGYVEREPHPDDRRKVRVVIRQDAIAPIAAVYAPMQQHIAALWSGYDVAELKLILDFVERSTAFSVDWVQELRGNEQAGQSAKRGRPAGARKR